MSEILERGDLFFLYRPKVQHEHVEGLDDVQRLYLVMKPEGEAPFRRIIMGRKQLPPPGWAGRRRQWAYVDEVEADPGELEVVVEPERYETKTQGARVQPEDRPVGEGVYAIAREGERTHLVYELEVPRPPGEVQEAFNILEQGSYRIEVKNPDGGGARRGPSAPGRPELPRELSDRFGGRNFVPLDPPTFLDHAYVEVLLMPDTAEEDPGLDLDDDPEDVDLFDELPLDRDQAPTDPLVERRWE